MKATITKTQIDGFECWFLENPVMRASILPALGGRVWELWDRVRERQWIWHRPGVPLAMTPVGAKYDEVWAGGWEELFPNDAPADFEGRALPDHGEWWTSSWVPTEGSRGDSAVLRLSTTTRVRGAACTKEFSLTANAPELEIAYRIENLEEESYHFLFKQHLAVAIDARCRLALPGGRVTPVQPGFGTLLPGEGPYRWPMAGGVDLSQVGDPTSRSREFLYVTDTPDGWCGVDDVAANASLRLSFDRSCFPYTWLFLTYGGWRDCYTAVLEPCTNLPKDLALAARSGQSARLGPDEVFETTVSAAVSELP